MSNTESKNYLLEKIDAEWPAFKAVLDAIPDAEMDRPGVVDQWCLKELLGHIDFWANKGARDVRLSGEGKPHEIELPGAEGVVDEWNAREAARGKAMTPADLRSAVQRSYENARRAVEEAPESALAAVLGGWSVGTRYAEDTYRHYREHAEQNRAWARDLETSEA